MASAPRQSTAPLKERLLTDARRFPFQQAIRLLYILVRNELGREVSAEELARRVRCRPELSLSFAGTDVTQIKASQRHPGRFLLTVTFLGLYGASSPLPTFYTEDLIDEWREGNNLTRGFYDLINFALYELFFQVWAKYQIGYQIYEARQDQTLQRLYALLGLAEKDCRDQVQRPFTLLRYLGLTTQRPCSAAGLRALMRDHLRTDLVQVEQCVPRRVPIPAHQRLLLGEKGCNLGEHAYLGTQIDEQNGKITLRIGPLDGQALHGLLPGTPGFRDLVHKLHYYLDRPLAWDLLLLVRPRAVQPLCLGGQQWSRLGWNSWLLSGRPTSARLLPVRLSGPAVGASPDPDPFT